MKRRDVMKLGLAGAALAGLPALLRADDISPSTLAQLPRLEPDGEGRYHLTLAPTRVRLDGRDTELWLYNGQLGPVLELTEGDRVEVRVTNGLAQPTTVHWHGLLVPAREDGGPHDAIAPGASRRYRFTVPAGNAGLHWFHPHPHGHTAEQIAHGAAGLILVKPKASPLPDYPRQLLMVTDLRLDRDGRVAPHTMADWMNGREGELLLVNGGRRPALVRPPATEERFGLVNACAGRYLHVRLEGGTFWLLGTDGGLLAAPELRDELLLVPGQRADLLLAWPSKGGEERLLFSQPYDRGWMGPEPEHYRRPQPLLRLVANREPAATVPELPDQLARIDWLPAAAVSRELVLSELMPEGHPHQGAAGHHAHGGHRGHGEVEQRESAGHDGHRDHARAAMPASAQQVLAQGLAFLINGRAFDMEHIMFEGKVGQVEEWVVENDSHMDHPFHVHGTHFQLVAEQQRGGDWRPLAQPHWLDTVNLRPYQKLKLRLRFDRPGDWLCHCHIIEHEELGMMATIRIV
ncbi:multicopper oxidase family protein [Zobellella iuensis]|uniref:Multicopper oxidase family protein n=1 Tax=Zobellella iuensis TaxID=2803811 RepID=A0ABS1QLS5_9GAMM|nr:multicopper oxidase family protein [Zobellella iuensis]MBL1375756.1 multicopper oxidase family protein [Zobellella iuensis]